ncbi:MAG: aminoglycoside 6-adenylyltransferase, partial [Oscillospiraceae bacterium]
AYFSTYAPCKEEALWEALLEAGKLFSTASRLVAEAMGFSYDNQWDLQVTKFLQYTKNLPRNATDIQFTP